MRKFKIYSVFNFKKMVIDSFEFSVDVVIDKK